MKATTIKVMRCGCPDCWGGGQGCVNFPDGMMPAGTTREHPDAWKLVRLGVAVPADEECEKKANMDAGQMERAQHAQRRASAGIIPDDFAAFDRGEMSGYYPDGSWKPGPNADKFAEEELEQQMEDSPLWFPK